MTVLYTITLSTVDVFIFYKTSVVLNVILYSTVKQLYCSTILYNVKHIQTFDKLKSVAVLNVIALSTSIQNFTVLYYIALRTCILLIMKNTEVLNVITLSTWTLFNCQVLNVITLSTSILLFIKNMHVLNVITLRTCILYTFKYLTLQR